MNDIKLDKIKKRIVACYNIANNAAATPNEIAVALKQASYLMQEYSLTMDDITRTNVNFEEWKFEYKLRMSNADMLLLAIIQKSCGVNIIMRKDYQNKKQEIVMYGRDVAILNAQYAFDFLSRSVENAKKEFIINNSNNIHYIKNKRKMNNDFCFGFFYQIIENVETNQLCDLDKSIFNEYNQQNNAIVKKDNSRFNKAVHMDSFSQGQAMAKDVSLNRAANYQKQDIKSIEFK